MEWAVVVAAPGIEIKCRRWEACGVSHVCVVAVAGEDGVWCAADPDSVYSADANASATTRAESSANTGDVAMEKLRCK